MHMGIFTPATCSFTRMYRTFLNTVLQGNLNVFAHTISFIFFFHQLLLLSVNNHSSILDRVRATSNWGYELS
ncbi:hypothetical protein BDR03DRAFT_470552 [Suillus americanus]|nr:hypothetical protein BDR03DRAFT_470552 [Suillus americanus]